MPFKAGGIPWFQRRIERTRFMTSRTFIRSGANAIRACGTAGSHVVRLAANENPLGISPRARDAYLDAVSHAHLYPFAIAEAFADAVGQRHGVVPEAVVSGHGSCEVLWAGVHALAGPECRFVTSVPTFGVPAEAAAARGLDVARVPLAADGTHDMVALQAAAESSETAVVYLCNPNNPTGAVTSCDVMEAWIRQAPERVRFLVDEAYFEFVDCPGYRSLDRLAAERPWTMVTRTFSKVFGMAGLRVGYGVAHPETAAAVERHLSEFNVNGPGLRAAVAALEDEAHVRSSVESNREARRVAEAALDRLGIARLPSQASFLMHQVPGDPAEFAERMRTRGFWIGMPVPLLPGYTRISLGSPQEMTQWAETLCDFRTQGWI